LHVVYPRIRKVILHYGNANEMAIILEHEEYHSEEIR
jgi:hypothetical protein